jgi:hypothetical protein
MTWTILVLAVLAVVLWGFYVSWRASRLDRLHNRTEAARTGLDLALVRRASAAAELASSGQLDPATSLLLADAVRRARQAEAAERDLAESDLTRALRATLGDPEFRAELRAGNGQDGGSAATAGPASTGPASTGPASASPASTGPASTGPASAVPAGAGDPDGDPDDATELLDEVEKAANQVFLARKFYNDVAGRTLDARRRPLARVLRLSGSARQPEFFEMDDALADGE